MKVFFDNREANKILENTFDEIKGSLLEFL